MGSDVNFQQLILAEIKDIKESQKDMRNDLSQKLSNVHKRIDVLVEDRFKCEINCKERDVVLEKQMWKTSGIVAGVVAFLFKLGEWIIPKIVK